MTIEAHDIMTTRVVTATPDMTVAQVARLLSTADISAVPVCEADGTLVGVVSEGDLLKPFTVANAMRRSWWLDVLSEGEAIGRDFLDYVRLDKRPVRNLMTRPVISVSARTTGQEIAEILDRHRIKRVPVVENGKLIGIVSRADLVRALARLPTLAADSS